MTHRIRALALTLAVVLCAAAPFAAQADDVPDRETSFQAVSGTEGEAVPGGALMVGAYALLWLVLGGYVFRLGRAQRTIEQDVASIEARVEKLGRSGD